MYYGVHARGQLSRNTLAPGTEKVDFDGSIVDVFCVASVDYSQITGRSIGKLSLLSFQTPETFNEEVRYFHPETSSSGPIAVKAPPPRSHNLDLFTGLDPTGFDLKQVTNPVDFGNIGSDIYYEQVDDFLGGKSFIRVLARPIWLEDRSYPVGSESGRAMEPICSIGYRYTDKPDELSFFIGEFAQYWFICRETREICVIAQPS
jgi:hypothetical protein